MNIGGERRHVVVVGDVQSPMLGYLCAQCAGVGHG